MAGLAEARSRPGRGTRLPQFPEDFQWLRPAQPRARPPPPTTPADPLLPAKPPPNLSSPIEVSRDRSPRRRSGFRGGPLRGALRQRSLEPPKGTGGRRGRGAQARAPCQSPSLRFSPGAVASGRRCPEMWGLPTEGTAGVLDIRRGCPTEARPADPGASGRAVGTRWEAQAQLAPAPGRASPEPGAPVVLKRPLRRRPARSPAATAEVAEAPLRRRPGPRAAATAESRRAS